MGGEKHRYNGAGFMLLGMMIEEITGLTYFDYVRKHIFAPAGPAADGGATSTLDDLVRFSGALRRGKPVEQELARAIFSPQVVESEENHRGYQWRYGFGCLVLLNGAGETVRWGHTGEEDGVSCRYYYYPQQDMDVVILGNQSGCAGKLAWDIHELVLH